jgi:anaerobic ribonucleoside-triphosphate reductase activating protein
VTAIPLFLSRVHYPVTTLGPGRRVCIWFQGCSIRCPGCVSLDTWAPRKNGTTVERVMSAISPWLADAEGITISGGEPFDQRAALHALLTELRAQSSADILVYSGYAREAIDLTEFAGLIDALIADPYHRDQPQTLALRGSDNQRLTCLTPLGAARFAPFQDRIVADEKTLDVMFDGPDGEIFLAGIPRRGDLKRFAALLESQGHRIHTTEDARDANEP